MNFINQILIFLSLRKSRLKIVWRYHYVPEGQLEPDKHGRWMVRGFLCVGRKALPQYKWWFKDGMAELQVPVAYIHQKQTEPGVVPSTIHRFSCCIATIDDANIGYGQRYFCSNSVEELQEIVEDSINKTYNVFRNAKRM